ncbi:hypothetical protein [Marinobacter iranensis]
MAGSYLLITAAVLALNIEHIPDSSC